MIAVDDPEEERHQYGYETPAEAEAEAAIIGNTCTTVAEVAATTVSSNPANVNDSSLLRNNCFRSIEGN